MNSPIYASIRQFKLAHLAWFEVLISLGLIGLGIFAWIPGSFYEMVGWPWVLVWQGAFGLIGIGCLVLLRRFQAPFAALGAGLDWVVLGVAFALASSALAAPLPLLALQNVLVVGVYGILLYALRNSQARWLKPEFLWRGLVWLGGISAVVSLAMWRPSPDMWLSDNFYSALRNPYPLGHHNFSGGYFVLVLPLAVGLVRDGWQRWVYGLVSLIVAFALYASGSRGALLGGLTMLAAGLVHYLWTSKGKAKLRAITLAVAALGLVLLLLGSNPRVRTLVSTLSFQSGPSQVVADGPARDRIHMAAAAGNIVRDRPLVGLGPGNMGRFYDRYRPIGAGDGLKQVQQLHNTPLHLLAELGIVGFGVYCWGAVCITRLWLRLRRALTDPAQRTLVTCLGIGAVGYSVSSFTDYQLENIPIALTLTVMLAALVKLQPKEDALPLLRQKRRWLSLLLLLLMGLALQFWLRTSLSLWLTHQGLNALEQNELSRADDKFYTAAMVTPWDPTPSALGAQQLSNIALVEDIDEGSQADLIEETITLYKQALTVSPNDVWFNQNLAVLASLTNDVSTAQQAMTRVVQLDPRSQKYSYYLLGLTYLIEGQTDKAVSAFALELLINPDSILLESWQQQLSELSEPIFSELQQHYETLLASLEPTSRVYERVDEQLNVVRWWLGEPVASVSVNRPLLKAIVASESNPEESLDYLDSCIGGGENENPDHSACQLLKAWLQPDEYLSEYLEGTNLRAENQAEVRQNITSNRDLKSWLRSTTEPISRERRFGLAFVYRNQYANQIRQILYPGSLRLYTLPGSLNLLPLRWSREVPALDSLAESVRAERLNLPHPTSQ